MSKLWLVWTVLYSKPTGLELYSYSETFAKKPFPDSRNLNKGFRLFPSQITPNSTQMPP